MYSLRRLRLLRELRDRGSIARVADALRYSPSSVSQQLAQLEREVGAQLLRREGRGLAFTAEGELLAERAGDILALLESTEAEIAAAGERVRATVRIASFQSALLALLPEALRVLAEEQPEIRVELSQREPGAALAETWARGFDMVIAEEYPEHAAPHHEGLVRTELTTDLIRLVVPPGLDRSRSVRSPADVADLPWVMEPTDAASRHFAEQRCRLDGFEPDVRYVTADLQAQLRLVESGAAVALIPDLMWAGAATTCGLVDLPGSPRRRVFASVREAGAAHPATRAVLDALGRAAAAADRTPRRTTGSERAPSTADH